MQVYVTKDKVTIVDKCTFKVHKGEYNINKIAIDFSEEYTSDLVINAVFSLENGKAYQTSVINNECDIPAEVLEDVGIVTFGVYAYKITEEEVDLRYSPFPTYFNIINGSYDPRAEESQEITTSQFEQYMQALQDGLNQVQEAINAVNQATTSANELVNEINQKLENGDFDGPEGPQGLQGPEGENGATFTPEVTEEGVISWTNDKDLTNPNPVNIKGPKGDTGSDGIPGPQGETGQQGPPGQGVPTGGTTGQVLYKTGEGDYETSWKDVESGGIPILVGTNEEPIDFINGMQAEGIYLVKGMIYRTTSSRLSEFSSPVLCFVSKYMPTIDSDNLLARFLFDFNGGLKISYNSVAPNSSSTTWTTLNLFPVASFYGSGSNNESVSTYLFNRYTGLNDATNISDLQTTDKSSLVAAINELKNRIDGLDNNNG